MNKMIFTFSLNLLCFSAATDKPSLKALFDQHRWFELRDAIENQQAPPLYKGAVASAFNDTQAAEKYFNETIMLNPASDEAAAPPGDRYNGVIISIPPNASQLPTKFPAWHCSIRPDCAADL